MAWSWIEFQFEQRAIKIFSWGNLNMNEVGDVSEKNHASY